MEEASAYLPGMKPRGSGRQKTSVQKRNGKKSGVSRRAAVAERDANICNGYRRGATQQNLALSYGLTQQAISKILRRNGITIRRTNYEYLKQYKNLSSR